MLFNIALLALTTAYKSEVWSKEQVLAAGIDPRYNNHNHDNDGMLMAEPMPEEFTWCNKDGKSYCTMTKNQHVPQYCGSCWAQGTVSALSDRVKIARGAKGVDINLSVQHVLNCGGPSVGTCYGGSVARVYEWLNKISKTTGTGISYESSNPYMSCSYDSKVGFCPHQDWSCSDINIARTCSTFPEKGGFCAPIKEYPHVTISDYGTFSSDYGPIAGKMMKEIYKNGPIACGIDAEPMLNYTSGVMSDAGEEVNHVISVVGWGKDETTQKQYWIVRNSWGEYWGEMGFVNVEMGNNAMRLEDQCSFATVDHITTVENQVHCFEAGGNCQ